MFLIRAHARQLRGANAPPWFTELLALAAGVYVWLCYRMAGFRKYGMEGICGWMQREES